MKSRKNRLEKDTGKIFDTQAILIVLMAFLADRITKTAAIFSIKRSPLKIFGNFFGFEYMENTGAAFSIFTGNNTFFLWFYVIIIGIIIYIFPDIKNKKLNVPLALVIGGIIGNLFDRIFLGYVIDFIKISVWPTFNIADSCIVLGGIWLLVIMLKEKNL